MDVEDLYRRYGPMVMRRCRQLLSDEEQALDATQDVFVQVLQYRRRLEDTYPSILLYRIATNLCLNRIRDRKRVPTMPGEEVLNRPRDADDELIIFGLEIERSPQTTFYVFTVRPLNPDPDLFIYDNPYEELDRQDLEDDLDDYNYSWDWIQNTPLTTGRSQIEIFWFELSFYGAYEVIVYAADKNFIDFLRTHGNVQEDDCNFHEPKFNIAGDGIGRFGAAIADTVQIRVLRE